MSYYTRVPGTISEYNNGNSSTTVTINWSRSQAQRVKWTANCTVTFTNPVAGQAYVLKVVNDGTARTITWPSNVEWSAATPPTFTGTDTKVDLLNFYYDGTSFFGSSSLNYQP
jgi:hypothetical protein